MSYEVLYDKTRQNVPVKVWSPLREVESQALDQLRNTASLPFVFKHVAAMPDVHLGKGATVGSVIATERAIIPAAVGVDIGCGMMAAKTSIPALEVKEKADKLFELIQCSVPLGHEHHRVEKDSSVSWKGWKEVPETVKSASNMIKAHLQMGTLGGGNHFIELCEDEEGLLWVMLHSGSRNVGKCVAEFHIDRAKGLMRQYMIHLPDPDLAYLVQETTEFSEYVRDLLWCQDYAARNREVMMDTVLKILGDSRDIGVTQMVNCHHNYAELENHFGKNVWVTRKGAVRARQGDLGIIPGSMGARSYIVRGKGNPESFCSCSHGAGRRLARNQAKKLYTEADLALQTEGVTCRKDSAVVDEIPAAYKDIDQVMRNQEDLVEVVAVLKQFVCVKG